MCGPGAYRRAATTAARRAGRTTRWRSRCARSAAATSRRAARPGRRAAHGRAGHGDRRRARRAPSGADLGPGDARALLGAWLRRSSSMLAAERRPDRPPAGRRLLARRPLPPRPAQPRAQAAAAVGRARGRGRAGDGRRPAGAALELFEACVPAIPYAPAAAFLGREKRRLAARGASRVRVALVADGVGSMHGVTRTLDEIRERGVPGFEVEVIGTDPHVDRRLPAVAEVEIPFYPACRSASRACPRSSRRSRRAATALLHVCSPGPAGVAAALIGADARAAARRLLPHGARRLRRAALRRPARRARRCSSRSPPSTAAATSSSPHRAAADARWRELGIAAGADRRAGTAASTSRASRPRRATPRRFAGRPHERALRRPADPREGRRPARRRVPRRRARATRGCTSCSPAAGPEEERLRARLGAPRRSSAGSTATRWPRPTRPPTCSCSARRPTRSARSCSRRRRPGLPVVAVGGGRPGRADRRRPQRPAVPAARRGARRRRRRPRRLARRCASGWRAAASPRCGAHLGGRARPARRGLAPRAGAAAARRARGRRRAARRIAATPWRAAPTRGSPSRSTTSRRRPSSAAR